MKFEIVQIDFKVILSVCCHPKILLPWQRDVRTFSSRSLAKKAFSLAPRKTSPFLHATAGRCQLVFDRGVHSNKHKKSEECLLFPDPPYI